MDDFEVISHEGGSEFEVIDSAADLKKAQVEAELKAKQEELARLNAVIGSTAKKAKEMEHQLRETQLEKTRVDKQSEEQKNGSTPSTETEKVKENPDEVKEFRILVQSMSGECHRLKITYDMKIESVKELLRDREGINLREISLNYQGNLLNDYDTVKEAKLEPNSCLFMGFRR